MPSNDPFAVQSIVEKPIKYIQNYWGQEIRGDKSSKNYDVEQSFLPKYFGRERMIQGSLPKSTAPRLYNNPNDRMIPVDTRVSASCWNEALAQSGPFYLRRWQIWDNAPYLPSNGDVSLDPRYGADTRKFTKPKTVHRNI